MFVAHLDELVEEGFEVGDVVVIQLVDLVLAELQVAGDVSRGGDEVLLPSHQLIESLTKPFMQTYFQILDLPFNFRVELKQIRPGAVLLLQLEELQLLHLVSFKACSRILGRSLII